MGEKSEAELMAELEEDFRKAKNDPEYKSLIKRRLKEKKEKQQAQGKRPHETE